MSQVSKKVEEKQVTIVKCRCGNTTCDYHGLSDGIFPKGSGWRKERAQQHADAINLSDSGAFDSLKEENRRLRTALEEIADRWDMDACEHARAALEKTDKE